MKRFPRFVFLYDGECGFCRRSLERFRKFDLLGRIEYVDANDRAAVSARFPNLPPLDFEHAMFAVDESGKIYRGFDAFRASLWASPVLAPFAWTWYLPGIRPAGTRVYDWIARNRRRFGCSGACSIGR